MRLEEDVIPAIYDDGTVQKRATVTLRPIYSREPFPLKDRLVGVSLVSIILLIAIVNMNIPVSYAVIASVSIIILGFVIAFHKKKPLFEAMVYVLVLVGIIATAVGSSTDSYLEIYASGMTLLLILLFAILVRNAFLIIPMILYVVWTVYAYQNSSANLISSSSSLEIQNDPFETFRRRIKF